MNKLMDAVITISRVCQNRHCNECPFYDFHMMPMCKLTHYTPGNWENMIHITPGTYDEEEDDRR